MKTINFLILIPSLVVNIGCIKHVNMEKNVWRNGDNLSTQKKLLSIKSDPILNGALLDKQYISIDRQVVHGIPVENTFIKKVKSEQHYDLIQTQVYNEELSRTVIAKNLKKHSDEYFLDKIKSLGPDFNKVELIKIENIYNYENNKLELYYKVTLINLQGEPYSLYFDQNTDLKNIKRVGTHFNSVKINVYTDGPKLSPLTEVLMSGLKLNPTISNANVIVESAANLKIDTLYDVMKFEPEDPRFDQIQVFYYLNKSLEWMKENLNFHLSDKIHAVVHIGFPEKTNSAFYFQNRIRLGSGDDVIYTQIPKDRSIIIHESFHAFIDHVAGLSNEGEGGSLNEAYADFFTSLQVGRPYLGEASYLKGPFKRSLTNTKKFQERTGGLYGDSLIFSGFMWEVKEIFGFEISKKLALMSLLELNPSSHFSDFIKAYQKSAREILNDEQNKTLELMMIKRGFTL